MRWRESDPDQVACGRCRKMKPRADVDRMLWCAECRTVALERAKARGWRVGLVVASVLALWIWFYIQPSDLVIGGWIATVLAAWYVAARVAREAFYAAARMKNRHASELVPPQHDPD